jgi:hypothetical protein
MKKLPGRIVSVTGTGCGTVIVDAALTFAEEARIVAVPALTADTNPKALTVATPGEIELHCEAAVTLAVL